MGLKLDTQNGEGLETHLRPYEAIALEEVWSAHERGESAIGSGAVWQILDEGGVKATPDARNTVSRASVIFFLNRMVDDGVLTYRDGTGKGGHHRLYYPRVSRAEYPGYVVKQVVGSLMRTFPDDPLILKLSELVEA